MEIEDEFLDLPDFGNPMGFVKIIEHVFPESDPLKEMDVFYKQAVERARKLGIDEAIRMELSSREKKHGS